MSWIPILSTSIRERRGLLWLSSVVVFWILILWLLPASREHPNLTAATRMHFAADDTPHNFVWRYTGERPQKGEKLRLFYRQGSSNPVHAVRAIAYLGDEKSPDTADPFFKSEKEPAKDYFEIQHEDIPSWPEGKTLWVGLTHIGWAIVWSESGPIVEKNLSGPVFRMVGQIPQQVGTEMSHSLCARVVGQDAPSPSPGRGFIFAAVYLALLILGTIAARGHIRWWLVASAFQGVLFFRALEVLFPSQWMWGGFWIIRFSPAWFWIGLGLIHFLCWPPVQSFLAVITHRVWYLVGKIWWKPLLWVVVPAAAWGFYFWASHPSFLARGVYGDAYASLEFPGYEYHNPLATAVYHTWRDAYEWYCQYRGRPIRVFALNFELIQLFVQLWAPVYLIGCALLAFQIGKSPREKLGLLAALLSMKTVVTFFGYLEVYGPALAVHVWVLAFLIWGVRRARVVLPSVASFVGYLFHMGGAMALPAVAVVWVVGFYRARARFVWLPSRLLATISLALLIWAITMGMSFIHRHDGNSKEFALGMPKLDPSEVGRLKFLPESWQKPIAETPGVALLLGSSGVPSDVAFLHADPKKVHYRQSYAWTTREHASQLVGEYLFIGGPALPWLILGIFLTRRRGWSSPQRWALALGAISFFIVTIFLATHFPQPKDWDVFSIQQLWWLVGALGLLLRDGTLRSRDARWMLFALLAYLLWDSGGWLWYNTHWGPPAPIRTFAFY